MPAELKRTVLRRVDDLVNGVRQLLPGSLLPVIVWLRATLAWRIPGVRADARRQMEFVLGGTSMPADLDAVARRYVKAMARRGEVRWHPSIATDLKVSGIENLQKAHAEGRGVIISFLHFGFYEAVWPAIARPPALVPRVMVHPYMLSPEAPGWIRQHVRVGSSGVARPVPSDAGVPTLLALLADGGVLALATDVPGRTKVHFLGRDLLGSFGAARLAQAANAPVVLLTTERTQAGPEVRLHPAIDPRDFESAEALLQEMLRRHEAAVLAWPEQYDLPLSRWKPA